MYVLSLLRLNEIDRLKKNLFVCVGAIAQVMRAFDCSRKMKKMN